MKPSPPTPRAVIAARLAVSASLVAALLWFADVHSVMERLRSLSLAFVLCAWGYYAGCQWLSSCRWRLFLCAKGIRDVPVSELFRYYMIGMFLNSFLPGAVGGDAAKAYHLYRRIGDGHLAIGTVVLERFSGLLGLSLLSLVSLALGLSWLGKPSIIVAVGAAALFLSVIVLALWWTPLSQPVQRLLGRFGPNSLGPRLQSFHAALAGYRDHPGTVLRAVALSLLIQGLYALFFGFVAWGLGIRIDVIYFVLFLPLVTLAMLVPISFGGLGVREAMLVLLFAQVGVPAADVLAVSLTAHGLNMLLSLWGGALMLAPAARRAALNEPGTAGGGRP
jgi:glycosyltransferase 2 family protein